MQSNEGAACLLGVEQPSLESEDGSQAIASTHVLVPHHQLLRLRALSLRTRVAQSEYLREAVDDLLSKYRCPPLDTK